MQCEGAARARRRRGLGQEVFPGARQDALMPQAALREILLAAGFDAAEAGEVEIVGDDPVLPVPYRVAAAAAAALGALGLAVANLSGKPQRVSVKARAAAI